MLIGAPEARTRARAAIRGRPESEAGAGDPQRRVDGEDKVISDTRNLTELAEVLRAPEALAELRRSRDLSSAYALTPAPPKRLVRQLATAVGHLRSVGNTPELIVGEARTEELEELSGRISRSRPPRRRGVAMPPDVPSSRDAAALADWAELLVLSMEGASVSATRLGLLLKGEGTDQAEEELAQDEGLDLDGDGEDDLELPLPSIGNDATLGPVAQHGRRCWRVTSPARCRTRLTTRSLTRDLIGGALT